MEDLDLYCVTEMKGKGNKAKLDIRKKAEIVKNFNLRRLNTHGCRYLKYEQGIKWRMKGIASLKTDLRSKYR